MQTVGVIGGAGFIGSYVTKIFLENNYKVKVSSTDISNKSKYQHLNELSHSDNLTVMACDVTDKAALQDFVKDCDIVIHSGTPFILDVQDPQTQLFDPTIKGTEIFLDVINNVPGVKKVVFVASVAAWNTNFPMPAGGKSFTDVYDETGPRFTSTESHPYAQAKFMANQVVEKFIANHPDASFEISSVSPVMVMGNSLSGRTDSTSGGLQYLIKNMIAPDAFIQAIYDNDVPFAIVDVRDVASAIFKAATTEGLHGKDYLLSSETYKVSDMDSLLNNREANEPASIVYKNGLASKDLDMQFRPAKETLASYTN